MLARRVKNLLQGFEIYLRSRKFSATGNQAGTFRITYLQLKSLVEDSGAEYEDAAGLALGFGYSNDDNDRFSAYVQDTRIDNAKQDKKLIAGIKEVLAHGAWREKSKMIDDLFSHQRVNEVYRLQHISEKNRAR